MARVLIMSGLAVAAVNSTPAHAAAWSLSEQAALNVGYDDNALLTTAHTIETANASTNVSAHLTRLSDSLTLSLDPRLVAVKYDNYSVLNRTEQYVTFGAQHQTELSTSALSASWTQDTTLTSELGLTGITQVNKRHQSTSVTISHTHQWTERWDTSTQLYAAGNHYVDAANSGLVNYNYGAAQFSIDYVLTPASQLSLQASMGKLQVPNFSSYGKTNSSATLIYSVSLAQRWKAMFSFGPSRVKSDFSSEQGTVYQVSINRQAETSTLQLAVSRDITPTGQGVLTQREQVSLSSSRNLTERLSLNLSGNWVKNNNLLLLNNLAFNAVRYNDVNLGINWQLTPKWTLSLSGGHTEQRVQTDQHFATRNHVALTLQWSGYAHSPRHLLH